MTRDKVIGMFLGVGIGDALGMPVETWTPERIKEKYPDGVRKYEIPDGHKWFNGEPAGSTTDDTQLTIAVAEGIIAAGYSIEEQKKTHVAALRKTDKGWGKSTRESVRNIANNCPETAGEGLGNGVPMKVAPIGACVYFDQLHVDNLNKIMHFLVDLTKLTHPTPLAISAAMAHVTGVATCFGWEPHQFNEDKFLQYVGLLSNQYEHFCDDPMGEDDLVVSMAMLTSDISDEEIIAKHGGGSCYVYHSLPFAYSFFLKNPTSIESMYAVVNAGGDTDSNASILGSLLGALNGTAIFPQHLVDGLVNKDELLMVANKFADFLGL